MLSESYIEFKNVWKKYSKRQIFHRSVREDFKSIFATKVIDKGLSDDEFWALREISFKVRAGECIGLSGV
ncbi:MAG: sugar ABC transporter ATP-binding protein, partial [Syntrophotalea sp.]